MAGQKSWRVTGNPEVISAFPGSVPRNALIVVNSRVVGDTEVCVAAARCTRTKIHIRSSRSWLGDRLDRSSTGSVVTRIHRTVPHTPPATRADEARRGSIYVINSDTNVINSEILHRGCRMSELMTSSVTDFKGKSAVRCHDSWQSVSRLLCDILQFCQCCGHNPTRAVWHQPEPRPNEIKRIGQARFTGNAGFTARHA